MQHYETIQVVRSGAVDWLTLNRPERLNAINGAMVDELWNYFSRLHEDFSCRVVVMRGAGRAFCSGLDLTWFRESGGQSPGGGDRVDGPGPSLASLIVKMRSCPQPIIALVHGAACGGGFNFVLAADVRIAGRSAKMNVAFVKLGLSGCELGTSYFLPRLVGGSLAAELMMTGRFLHAERALAAGLVSEIVADDQLESAAQALVSDMLSVSPIGLRKTKETLCKASEILDLAAVIALEERTQMICLGGRQLTENIENLGKKSAEN
jgi:enoyl-CoA hydratase/carnithine racemase